MGRQLTLTSTLSGMLMSVCAAEAELVPEQEQQDQDNNYQQNDCQHAAVSAAAVGFDDCYSVIGIMFISHVFTP